MLKRLQPHDWCPALFWPASSQGDDSTTGLLPSLSIADCYILKKRTSPWSWSKSDTANQFYQRKSKIVANFFTSLWGINVKWLRIIV